MTYQEMQVVSVDTLRSMRTIETTARGGNTWLMKVSTPFFRVWIDSERDIKQIYKWSNGDFVLIESEVG